jgi:hypothetical protein
MRESLDRSDRLRAAVLAVCPVEGISVGKWIDRSTWRIDYSAEATPSQKSAAAAVMNTFDGASKAPASFLARDLFALLTVADFSAIKKAIAANDALGLLWDSLKAQGEAPIITDSRRFQQGWDGIKAALGPARALEISSALGI